MMGREIPWPEGVKKTKQRQAVAQVLAEAESPLTVQELAERLEQEGQRVWLSTVYRVLDLFAEKGLVLRTMVVDTGTAIYELARDHHRHYAVCLLCGRAVPMENCPMERFSPQIGEEGFHVLGHRLQIYGHCGGCSPDKDAAEN